MLVAAILKGVLTTILLVVIYSWLNGNRILPDKEECKEAAEGSYGILIGFPILMFKKLLNFLMGAKQNGWLSAIVAGILAGVVKYFTPRLTPATQWWAPVMLVTMIGLMAHVAHLIYRWCRMVSARLAEFLPFITALAVIRFCYYRLLQETAVATSALWDKNPFWDSVFGRFLPFLVTALTISIPIVRGLLSMAEANRKYAAKENTPRDAKRGARADAERYSTWATIIGIATFLVIALHVWILIDWSTGSSDAAAAGRSTNTTTTVAADTTTPVAASATTAQATTEAEEDWYFFLNAALLTDEDESNDFNFGKNPYNKEWKAADYDRDFRECLALDPALLAGDSAWLDAIVGTRYLGTFYEECKGEWASTINTAKRAFMEDQLLYYKTLDAFFLFLDSAESVELKQGLDMDDQMYMNPYTVDGVPDVIVMETLDHGGWFLVYTFVIKDQVFEVAYRIDCGYQPTNVEKVMDIKPQPKPEPPVQPTTPAPTKPAPTTPAPTTPVPTTPVPTTPVPTTPAPTTPVPTTPVPTTPVPTTPAPTEPPTEPPTTPQYTKDPSKGMNPTEEEKVRPNDDKGPGPNTNPTDPAADPSKSAKDNENNSPSYPSYDDYKKEMEEKKKTNESQKTGKDDNTPTPTTAASTTVAPTTAKPTTPATTAPTTTVNVNNNGDTGNGGAPINDKTPTESKVNYTDPASPTTGPISNETRESWGGPSD